MAAGRPLRVLLFSSNGSSTGHVVRVLAVARALRQLAAGRHVPLQLLLATTSGASRLLDWAAIPSLRLPCPAVTSSAGWAEPQRLAVLGHVLEGAVAGFAPDVLIADTFPAGPHFELRGVVAQVRHRILLRRCIRPDRLDEPEICAGLESYQLAILVDDPGPQPPQALDVRTDRVPPITLLEPAECLSRQTARRALGIGPGRAVLLCFGGGGDEQARATIRRAVPWLKRSGFGTVVVAEGQLPDPAGGGKTPVRAPPRGASSSPPTARETTACAPSPMIPLQRYLAAFDVAVAAAGYNTAHELASQRVASVLWARPREFDDQAARARRFEKAGLGVALQAWTRTALLEAVARAVELRPPRVTHGGAACAARLVLEAAA